MTWNPRRFIPPDALRPQLAWAILIEILLASFTSEFTSLLVGSDLPREWAQPLYAGANLVVAVVFPFTVARYLGAHHVFVAATVAGVAEGVHALFGGLHLLSSAAAWPTLISVPLAALISGLLAAVVGACAGAAASQWRPQASAATEPRWYRKPVIHGPFSVRVRLLFAFTYFALAAIGSFAPANVVATLATADVSNFEGARGIAASLMLVPAAVVCTLVIWFVYPLVRRHDHALVLANLVLLGLSAWSYSMFRWLL